MKKIFFSLFVAGFFILTSTASAHMGMMDGYSQQYEKNTLSPAQTKEINDVLQNIYKTQNIDSQTKIDCSKVTDDQFENLGDAYMNVMLLNQQQHEAMDNMMGGEGSATLKQAHINMGRSYLGCWSNYDSGPVYMPMMGGFGMMGGSGSYGNYYAPSGMMGWSGMMGGYYGGFGWVTMVLVWTLLVLGIIATVKWLRKK